MDLATFERRAFEIWEAIPARFRVGVSAFVVDPGAYKMGVPEDYVYGYCEPDPVFEAVQAEITSRIVLFYASFVFISRDEPDFDWEYELWETIRHELQHHLEWRAGVDHRGDEDDWEEQVSRRLAGLPFEVDYHRHGLQLDRNVWLTVDDLHIEVAVVDEAWAVLALAPVEAAWGGVEATAPAVPQDWLEDDVVYVDAYPADLEDDERLPWKGVVIVLRRQRPRKGLLGWLKALVTGGT